jgi:hypothetical protein
MGYEQMIINWEELSKACLFIFSSLSQSSFFPLGYVTGHLSHEVLWEEGRQKIREILP